MRLPQIFLLYAAAVAICFLAALIARADTFAVESDLQPGRYALLLTIDDDGAVSIEQIPLVRLGDPPTPRPGPNGDNGDNGNDNDNGDDLDDLAEQVKAWADEVDRPAEAAMMAEVYRAVAGRDDTQPAQMLSFVQQTVDALDTLGQLDGDAWAEFRRRTKGTNGVLIQKLQEGTLSPESLLSVAAGLDASATTQLPPFVIRLVICAVGCVIQGGDDFTACLIGCLLDVIGADEVGDAGCCGDEEPVADRQWMDDVRATERRVAALRDSLRR